MRNLQKMKRMSIDDVQMGFSKIEKEEQALYVGKWRYTYDSQGNLKPGSVNDGKNTATICVEGRSETTELLSNSDFISMKDSGSCSANTATQFFDFIHRFTNVEWCKKKEDGKWTVFTDHDSSNVNPRTTSKTEEVTHSHTGKSAALPSPDDQTRANQDAAKGYHIKWTVAYNGTYQNYEGYGAYGEPYKYGYSY